MKLGFWIADLATCWGCVYMYTLAIGELVESRLKWRRHGSALEMGLVSRISRHIVRKSGLRGSPAIWSQGLGACSIFQSEAYEPSAFQTCRVDLTKKAWRVQWKLAAGANQWSEILHLNWGPWGFIKWGYPKIHHFWGFPIINHPFWGIPPSMETPI